MRKLLIVALALLSSLSFMAFGAVAQDDATIAVRDDPALGPILTDPEGMTLYLFTKDEEGTSTCYDQCAENWPPFTAEEPLTLPEGVEGELTLIDRDDGTQMVAYNGIPLYSFINDKEPGDTTGQGVGDVWYVVAPGQLFGAPVATPAASPVATPVASPVASPAAGSGAVEVSLSEFAIDMPTTLPAGPTVFNVTNDGEFPHNLEIEGQGIEVALENNLESGQGGTLEVDLPAGTYEVYCPVGNHADRGMRLELTVTD